MIQRIQSIYLFFTFIITGILPFLFPLWVLDSNLEVYFMTNTVYILLFGFSTALSIWSLFYYKKRQNQFVMNRLNIILNLILLGLFVYRTLNLSGEIDKVSEKGISMFLPIVAILLLVLANKAIKRDEDLVKSVDRLR
jgi:membrane protease YdiL (CAAX protease family)